MGNPNTASWRREEPRRTGIKFDAFISYSHTDRQAAAGIERGLKQIGRSMWALRALQVFKDDTELSATPDLWGRIVNAIDASRHFIVVLSPAAVGSFWVAREVAYWLETRGPENLHFVLAGGELSWDAAEGRFDPTTSSAAIDVLTRPGVLPAEPLYVDIAGDSPWDPSEPRFREHVVSLAAPIHGKPRSELSGEDVREQRRLRRWRHNVVVLLSLLTAISLVASYVAVSQSGEASRQRTEAMAQRDEAVRQRNVAVAMALSVVSGEVLETNDALALALANEAYFATPTPTREATSALVTARVAFDKTGLHPFGPPMLGHTSDVYAVAITHDGRLVASGGLDGSIRIWDPATGRQVGEPLVAGCSVEDLAFSPGGVLASVGCEGGVRLWDVESGSVTKELRSGDIEWGLVTFSPDGSLIASAGGFEDVIQLWDAKTGRKVGPAAKGVVASALTFSPDGKRLLTGDLDGNLQLWDGHRLRLIKQWRGHTEPVTGVGFSPDGTELASVSEDSQLRQWDSRSGAPLGKSTVWKPGMMLFSLVYSPNGAWIAVGGSHGEVHLLDRRTGKPVGRSPQGSPAAVFALAFGPDSQLLVSGGGDDVVRRWAPGPQRRVKTGGALAGRPDVVLGLAIDPSGHYLAASDIDATVRVWNTADGALVGKVLKHQSAPAFSPDGTQLATCGTTSGSLQLWDASSQVRRRTIELDAPCDLLQFSPDGSRLAVAIAQEDDSEELRVWDTASWTPVGAPVTIATAVAVAFSADARQLAAVTVENPVAVWTLSEEPSSRQLAGSEEAATVAFSPDGRLVAVGGNEAKVGIWSAVTGAQRGGWMTGHDARMYVDGVAFSPDGRLLVSASEDGTVRLWDSATGDPVGPPLIAGSGGVIAAEFTAGGSHLVSVGGETGLPVKDVWTWDRIWEPSAGCDLVDPLVTRPQLDRYLPAGWTTTCVYSR